MDILEKSAIQPFTTSLYVLDPIQITRILCHIKPLSDKDKTTIYSFANCHEDRISIWKNLFPVFERHFNLVELLRSILRGGHLELFLRISSNLRVLKATNRNVTATIPNVSQNRQFPQNLLINFKLHAYNYIFDDPGDYFHYKSRLYKHAYLNEDDPVQRMKKADIYAVSVCTEIDVWALQHPQNGPDHYLFDVLKNLIPITSNTHVTQLLYDTRMATAYAMAGKDEMAESYVQSGMCSSLFLGYCVEIVNIVYITVYNLMSRYDKCPSVYLLDRIVQIAHIGLQSLQEEKEESIRDFSRRRFYHRIAFCLLGIRNKGDVIPNSIVRPENIRLANEMLVEIEKTWSGIEARRQMFYYVAKARIADLENTTEGTEFAIKYINMAVHIGKEGNFGEHTYMKRYANSLKDRSK